MSSMVLDGAAPRSRASDPVTSVEAGRSADLTGSQDAVFSWFEIKPEWTQSELERAMRFSSWSPSRIRSAVSELQAMGLVETTGKTRETKYGRQARVYRAVKAVSR
ncbi:hypothetical protein G7068_11850 [Leucobacter viscericola]|uniref:MarR family transcriptional regulator n=1 Tax=Leucobacter viscericola TaxID=2714935 RepID=A0A6G7XH18_9MICO|nr:hypothetical protein [Leucobacter viscericola]QIK63802.1 hypothetical protein G7068_11850 [Leucobacter viscericola]